MSETPPLHPRIFSKEESQLCHQLRKEAKQKEELDSIRAMLEQLQERRSKLEQQRSKLLAEGTSTKKSSAVHSSRASSRPSKPHSRTSSMCAVRRENNASLAVGEYTTIPSEQERRERLHHSRYFALKEALQEAAKEDSMCQIGSFLLEDSSKVYTFGRERRFRPIVGQKGKYYLSTNVEMNDHTSGPRRSRSVPCGSSTPGPGAYTPRYGKLSKPSVLTYLR